MKPPHEKFLRTPLASTGRNGQWKSREKIFAITQNSVSAAV